MSYLTFEQRLEVFCDMALQLQMDARGTAEIGRLRNVFTILKWDTGRVFNSTDDAADARETVFHLAELLRVAREGRPCGACGEEADDGSPAGRPLCTEHLITESKGHPERALSWQTRQLLAPVAERLNREMREMFVDTARLDGMERMFTDCQVTFTAAGDTGEKTE